MKIGAPREIFEGENRVALTPDSALQLGKLGHVCAVESGAGAKAGFSDAAYLAAGVEVLADAAALFAAVDVVVKVRGPEPSEVDLLREGLSRLDARSRDIVKRRWLDPDSKITLQELADEYGVSAERIRQIEANALKKMKALFAA